MSFKVGKPASREGFSKDAHNGHLLVFTDARGEEVPKYQGDGTQLTAMCGYVVCVPCGLVLADQRVYGEALAPRIVDAEEKIVAGVLGQAPAKAGRNPAWILEDPTDDDIVAVQEFLANHASEMPSGRIVIEAPAEQTPSDDKPF
jgi:hypothetical protein